MSGSSKTGVKGNVERLQDYKPFIRDGMGDIFIPGTSLKGVFRTAVLYNMLKSSKDNNLAEFKEVVEKRISTDIDKKIPKKKFFQWGMEKWLESFVLEDKKSAGDKIKTRCPNTDWFRMFHVADAYPVELVETILIPVNILKKETSGWKYKTESAGPPTIIWIECIPAGAIFEFNISWDKKLFDEFKKWGNKINSLPKNLDEILSSVSRWAGDVHGFEKDFSEKHELQKWYQNNTPNFRIGFGSGMTSTTIAILLDEELRKKVRNYAGLNKGDATAPKSRRVWLQDNAVIPLGWATI
ncbi:MAG: type III-A CRISPR-associated RAMP protein Csm5 [Nitrospirae bacterium]|nr:type III-A CRISPR-associated RAMP protein Csm5 [Nitrospirota bacterium]